MRRTRTRSLALTGTLLASLLALVAAVIAASPAGAHDGDAVFAVEAVEPQPDGAIHYVVRVTWADDGHAALDTTVTATPVAGDGTTQTPVPMTAVDQDGRYEATVAFPNPGAWTIRFTSIDPNGTSEQAQEVAEPTTTTTASTTTAAEEPTTTAATETDTETASASQSSDDDSSSGGGGVVVALVIAVLVVVAAAGYWFWRSQRSQAGGGPDAGAGESSTESAATGTT